MHCHWFQPPFSSSSSLYTTISVDTHPETVNNCKCTLQLHEPGLQCLSKGLCIPLSGGVVSRLGKFHGGIAGNISMGPHHMVGLTRIPDVRALVSRS